MPDVRTAPHVSLLLQDGGWVLYDSHQRRYLGVDRYAAPVLAELLRLAAGPVDRHVYLDRIRAVTGCPPEQATATLDGLLAEGVLVPGGEEGAARTWRSHGWGPAYAYHHHVRAIPAPDWSTPDGAAQDIAGMAEYVAAEPPPPLYLDRATSTSIALARADAPSPGALCDTITAGRPSPLDLAELGSFLHFAFGQRGARRLPVTGLHVRKTSPSGGSRHPTEAYVLVHDVTGLARGTYHYSVRDHALDLLDPQDPAEFFDRHVLMLGGRMAFVARVIVILTSLVERSMFRYRDSRSYRVLYLDAGHLLQTFAYLASARGRPSYRGYCLHTSAVSAHLGIDALMEMPLAFGAIA